MARREIILCLFGICASLPANPARGHVDLLLPNGGLVLQVGSVYPITWIVSVPHDLQNWDLSYSVDSGASFITIVMDLPPGDGSQGAIHTYDWTIPDTPSTHVRVRVLMDNSGFDYRGESFPDLVIEPAPPTTHVVKQEGLTFVPADITVEPGDTVRWDWSEGVHTVTSGVPCTPDGASFDAPLNAGATRFDYVIPDDGTSFIPYFCMPHCGDGMAGTITVGISAVTGACCDDTTETCSQNITQSSCEGAGARYGGDGSTCATIDPPCVVPTGACYDDATGRCNDGVTRADCEGSSLRYDGDYSYCPPPSAIPAISQWGLVGLTLLLLAGGKTYSRRWRSRVAG